MKKTVIFIELVIIFSACCPIVQFVPQSKIEYSNSHLGDTLDYEFAVVKAWYNIGKKDYCDLFQAVRSNASSTINKKDISIFQDGESLKFDLVVLQAQKWKKVKNDTTTLQGRGLVKFQTKAKASHGQSLTIVERNYPAPGDSVVVRIQFDDIDENDRGIYGRESVVGKMIHGLMPSN